MSHTSEQLVQRFLDILVTGDRPGARALVQQAIRQGLTPDALMSQVFWPTYKTLEDLDRNDHISKLSHHTATRLLRILVDQIGAHLNFQARNGKRVMAFCGRTECDELGAQIASDLMEAAGFEVTFCGGGVALDEITTTIQERQPDVVVLFASSKEDLPGIRALIDTIRDNTACDRIQLAVGAGVFARNLGLGEEMGFDLWGDDPIELITCIIEEPERRADPSQRLIGRARPKKSTQAA